MLPQFRASRIICLLGAGLLAGVAACILPADQTPSARAADDPQALRSGYSQKVAAHYKLPFAADRPFLPSNATTDTGEFIDPKSFPTAEYCGHCHQQAHAEWRQTAHANSFRNPWYVKNVNLLTSARGIEFTRHCEGCDADFAAGQAEEPRSRSAR